MDNKAAGVLRLLPLYIVIFIGFVGYSLMITILTPMILYDEGGIVESFPWISDRSVVLGIVLTLYPLGQFFGSPVLGALSDRFGRRPVLLVSLVATTICYAIFAYSLQIEYMPLLMAISLVTGLAEANIVIAQSAIADVTTEENRSRLFGYIYMSASSAYVVGPLVGGKLADSSVVSWFSYATPYWAVFVLLILTFIYTFGVFRETRPKEMRNGVNYTDAFTNLGGLVTNKKIRFIYLVNFLIYLAIFGFFRAYPMYLVDEYRMHVGRVADFIAWVAVPIVIANLWVTGFLAKRYGARNITIVSSILMGLFTLVILLPKSEWALWITLFLPGFALAVALPACSSMLSLMVGAEEQGRVLGNNQALQVGSEAISGFIAGLLAAMLFELPLITVGIVAIGAGVLLWVGGTRDPNRGHVPYF